MAEKKPNEKALSETPAAVTTHQEFLRDVDPKIMQALKAMEDLKGMNEVRRAVRVKSIEVLPGKAKMNDGAPVFDNDGNQEMWPDSFFVEVGSMDGTVKVRIDKELLDGLKIGEWYIAVGRVDLKAPYGSSRIVENVKYTEFQPLLGISKA